MCAGLQGKHVVDICLLPAKMADRDDIALQAYPSYISTNLKFFSYENVSDHHTLMTTHIYIQTLILASKQKMLHNVPLNVSTVDVCLTSSGRLIQTMFSPDSGDHSLRFSEPEMVHKVQICTMVLNHERLVYKQSCLKSIL